MLITQGHNFLENQSIEKSKSFLSRIWFSMHQRFYEIFQPFADLTFYSIVVHDFFMV